MGAGGERLRIASFNLWRGGEASRDDVQRSRDATLAALRAIAADIVGLQETNARTPEYAERLHLSYVDQGRGRGIMSRFPIVDMKPNGLGVTIQLPFGVAHIFNVHLSPRPYQPYQLAGIPYENGRFIATAADAIDEARKARADEVASLVTALDPALASGNLVFVAGDFNEPSHLDWTARAAAAGRCMIEVAWPASRALAAIGMRDAFRVVFPDEVVRPGHTWTSRPAAHEVCDRIDRIYFAGACAPIAATILGEASGYADVAVSPWPSDHRALVVTFAGYPPASRSRNSSSARLRSSCSASGSTPSSSRNRSLSQTSI